MVLGRYCFDVDAFAADAFSVETFLEDCRTRNPMETVHQDLRDFQTSLENQVLSKSTFIAACTSQLVEIINEDYAEFLQLSTKLKGVDDAVSTVRPPILAILKRVDVVQQTLRQLQAKIHVQLATFSDLQQQERDLQLSIQISERMLLLEELLEIAHPLDNDDDADSCDAIHSPVPQTNGVIDDNDDDDGFANFDAIKQQAAATNSTVETCARLERAAQNLVALELECFQGADVPLIQREEKRLAVIEETLLRRLETEFATEIFPDTFYTTREHVLNATTLSFLLRAYVLLQRPDVPEAMVARLLVQPFLDDAITRTKIDGRVRGSCDGLGAVYDTLFDFIDSTFTAVLALPVCQCSDDHKNAVDLLGNAIWTPLVDVFITKHSVIFQAADVDRFHRTYTQSMAFLARLEAHCCATNDAMKLRFRAHERVAAFSDQWNMDVYFQLRATQLAATLERSLTVARGQSSSSNSSSDTTQPRALLFASSHALWDVLQQCWHPDVFLEPLVARFAKLCGQMLLCYIQTWEPALAAVVAQLKSATKIDFAAVPLRVLTSDDDIVSAGSDFCLVRNKIVTELVPVVAARVAPFVDSTDVFVQTFFDEALASLDALAATCWSVAAIAIADECKKVLPALRTVKGQYQMTNKPLPTTPSAYIASVVRPLDAFVTTWHDHFAVGSAARAQLMDAVVTDVSSTFDALATDVLKSAYELEESLKSRKLQRNASSSLAAVAAGLGSASVSDTDKMRMQLCLDLEEMQRQVLTLGFATEQCDAFQRAFASLKSSS